MSWEDGVLEKAYYDYKLDEFLKEYKFDKDPSEEVLTMEEMNIGKSLLDDMWVEWLAYMENVNKEVFDVDFAEYADDSWAILDFVEQFYHYLGGYLKGSGVIPDDDEE